MNTARKERTNTVNSYEKEFSIIRKDEREDEFYLYSYELTMRKSDATASYRVPLYSINVSVTDAYGNESRGCVTDAFADAKKALKFYEKVLKNLATPIDIAYVLEDSR